MDEKIIQFVTEEKQQIEDATFDLRERIKRARRNYEGKYDEAVDSVTGKRKIFMPLTKQEVDTIAVRFDLDPESIVVKTNEPALERKALIWEELLKHQFTKMEWRARMKESLVPWINEGTIVIELYWDGIRDSLDFVAHDIKDVYIFPKEPSLEKASMFAVRRRVLRADFLKSERYKNKDKVLGSTVVREMEESGKTMVYELGRQEYQTELEYVELYERYGYFPKNRFA